MERISRGSVCFWFPGVDEFAKWNVCKSFLVLYMRCLQGGSESFHRSDDAQLVLVHIVSDVLFWRPPTGETDDLRVQAFSISSRHVVPMRSTPKRA